ncbi:MAG: YncE family protein, partial [Steroidobacteraceae bacterium]
ADGAVLGSFPVGSGAHSIAFDGAHIWVANLDNSSVAKLRAADGAVLGSFPVGNSGHFGIAFDGTNIWVDNSGHNSVSKL